MPPLRIPPRYRSGIQALARLSPEQAGQLIAAMEDARQRLATEQLASDAVQAVPELGDDAFDALEALLSLIALLDEDDSTAEQLANDVAHSQDIDLDESERDEFGHNVAQLLSLRPLAVAARAYDLMAQHERIFHDARVFTDIRPVFGQSAAEGARAALIVAMLKIDWHPADGSTDSAYYALDRSDLLRLREVVDRALDKVGSLENLIARMDLPYWEFRHLEEDSDGPES